MVFGNQHCTDCLIKSIPNHHRNDGDIFRKQRSLRQKYIGVDRFDLVVVSDFFYRRTQKLDSQQIPGNKNSEETSLRQISTLPPSIGCFRKWWYPQNTPKWSFLGGKPMVVGYHHFWKHPISGVTCCQIHLGLAFFHQPFQPARRFVVKREVFFSVRREGEIKAIVWQQWDLRKFWVTPPWN